MRGGDRTALGLWGEEQAAGYLESRGYAILHRRYHCREGELDLVAEGKGYLCFVEVKTRQSARCGAGREAVDWRKQRNITATAFRYLAQHPEVPTKIRFDVAEIVAPQGVRTEHPELHYLANAFACDPSNLTELGGSCYEYPSF